VSAGPDVLRLGASTQVTFHRAALAVPGGPLPGSTGTCALRWVDGEDDLPGVATTLDQDTAMWLSFRSLEPVALEVVIDGVNAVTGLPPGAPTGPVQSHLVLPEQRWLDGVRRSGGRAEQIVGPAEGQRRTIRLVARRLRGAAHRSWWVRSGEIRRANRFGDPETVMAGAAPEPSPGVDQRIESDPFEPGDWDLEPFAEVEVHLLDSRHGAGS
jgi:hypothetical protein